MTEASNSGQDENDDALAPTNIDERVVVAVPSSLSDLEEKSTADSNVDAVQQQDMNYVSENNNIDMNESLNDNHHSDQYTNNNDRNLHNEPSNLTTTTRPTISIASSRTNRAPPTMAFFRRRTTWNANGSSENQAQQETNIRPALSYESQIDEVTNSRNGDDNNDLTSSLISNQQQQQHSEEWHGDRLSIIFHWLYEKYIFIRDILMDPYTYEHIRQIIFESETYEYVQRTIRRSGNYIAICTLFTMLVLVPIVLYRQLTDRKLDLAAIHSAQVMVIGTIIMSLRLVYLHLTHWFMPDVQKYVVRILWMVPIYAIQSYLSLRYHHARVYMSTIRDFYEAFVITSFVYYLMELLGGHESLIQILQRKDQARYGQHKFPFSLVLQPWVMGEDFLLQCKHGVLQYVVFKTTATVLIFLCEYSGVYGEGHFEWFLAYPYLCFFQNFSVMYALYCLVIFFHACNDELHHPVNWHPLGKFLCVKGVVFFTWWQGVVIFYLRDHGFIGPMGPWSSIDVAHGFIDYCIVVEMVGFAIAHSYTFTYIEYLPGRFPQSSIESSNLEERNAENDFSRALLSTTANSNDDCLEPQRITPKQNYRPPATLPEPMRFRDALWSSTVPRETIQDIQRLRVGMQNQTSLSRGISIPAFMNFHSNNNDPTNDDNPDATMSTVVVCNSGGDPELEHPPPESEPSDAAFV